MTDDNNDVDVRLYSILDTFICSGMATQEDSQQIFIPSQKSIVAC
jgi:hypothetical protein